MYKLRSLFVIICIFIMSIAAFSKAKPKVSEENFEEATRLLQQYFDENESFLNDSEV